MKLLILTQKVDKNDSNLGFFHAWIDSWAKSAEVTVVCLEKGVYDFSHSVRVYSLGKEEHTHKLTQLIRFYWYSIRKRNTYDVVLVHMTPIYCILGGLMWKMLGKKVGLWYAHKSVDTKLRLAVRCVDRIFTPSRESFRLPSSKVEIVGHGIDTDVFAPGEESVREKNIISVGRISRVKDIMTLLEAYRDFQSSHQGYTLTLIGEPLTDDDRAYDTLLKTWVSENGLSHAVEFKGGIPNRMLPGWYQKAHIAINMSHTGSLDKSILESLACRTLTLTCNEGARDVLGTYRDFLMYTKGDSGALREDMERVHNLSEKEQNDMTLVLRENVVGHHSLNRLTEKIIHRLYA